MLTAGRLGRLDRARVDRAVGGAEGEGHLARGVPARARDVAGNDGVQLDADAVWAFDGGVLRSLSRQRLLDLLLRHRARDLHRARNQVVGEGLRAGLGHLDLAAGPRAEAHAAAELRARLRLDVVRAVGA